MLEAEGYEVATAEATLEANPLIFCKNPPSLIMIDVEMPLLNGGQTTQLLKLRSSSKDIAILMTSAKSREELTAIVEKSGADGFICKPLLPEVLLSQVRSLVFAKK
jgi:DNA-binding response OmpR family regulator